MNIDFTKFNLPNHAARSLLLPHISILFVEDSDVERFLIESIIEEEKLPITPSFAADGPMALKDLSTREVDAFPDAIIVDLHLPQLSGFAFAEACQELMAKRQLHTYLFLTSACITPCDRRGIEKDRYFQGCWEKPFSAKHFMKRIYPIILQKRVIKEAKPSC